MSRNSSSCINPYRMYKLSWISKPSGSSGMKCVQDSVIPPGGNGEAHFGFLALLGVSRESHTRQESRAGGWGGAALRDAGERERVNRLARKTPPPLALPALHARLRAALW